ncbi:MAG: hypothetical protein KatS3mg060_1592 [Dehalococcoidia bacterium]|nr:MAG: hypothetical protein KatS3mg060_1592 [Dehalococcoidia bacterium]
MLYSREERRLLTAGEIARKAVHRVWRMLAPPRLPELAALMTRYGRQGDAPAVLFLGDSVLDRVSRTDNDRRSLRTMLEELADDRGGGLALGRPAFHPGVFVAMMRAVLALPQRPQAVVVAINLRCFSPQWDRHPGWQFEREIVAFERFAAQPFQQAPRLRPFQPSSEAMRAYDAEPVQYLGGAFDTIGGYRRLIATKPADEQGQRFRRAQIFVYHYLFDLSVDHRRLSQLRELLRLASDAGLPTLLYVTPVNVEGGSRLVGPQFAECIAAHVRAVRDALDRDRPVLDLSALVDSDGFLYPEDPTEHLNERGRAALVRALRPALDEVVPSRTPSIIGLAE